MKLKTAIDMSNCRDCVGVAKHLESPDEFGIYNGHILNVKATMQLDMPCLCGEPANGLQEHDISILLHAVKTAAKKESWETLEALDVIYKRGAMSEDKYKAVKQRLQNEKERSS